MTSGSSTGRHLVLVGLMGVGKTTVGVRCAALLDRPLVDTDELVVAQAGVPFEDIRVLHGDTQVSPKGMDTYGSRSLAVGGTALVTACDKVIEKAKGILMKSRGISEEEAYALLRKTAMNESRRVADVARSLVTAAKLLG